MINRPGIFSYTLKATLISIATCAVWLPLKALANQQQWLNSYTLSPGISKTPIEPSQRPSALELTENLGPHPQIYLWMLNHQQLLWITACACAASLVILALLVELLRRRSRQTKLLKENEERHHDLANLGSDLFWELDKNLCFSHFSGDFHYLTMKDLAGKTLCQALTAIPYLEADWDSLRQLLAKKKPIQSFILRLRTSGTTLRIFKINAKPLFDKKHQFQGYRGLQREMTEQYQLSQTIAYQATYDPLTGLINRNEFDTRLQQAVKRVRDRGTQAVLGYLDLDQFKIVNDTAGHLIGDQLLTDLAQLLQQNIRNSDSLGRLGGDEFGLLLEGCSLDQGKLLSQTLVAKVKDYRFTWQGRQFNVGVSIGLVPIAGNDSNATELLSRADLACYKAKDLGRGRVYIAEQDDVALEQQHLELVHIANIPQAIEENRFYLMEQPIISLFDDSHKHVEILLRLTDDQGEVVPPNLFIPMAERYGMIGLIDRWVVETVLTNYERYYPDAQTIVSINLSGSSLSDESFTEFVTDLLNWSTIPADRLCFEITETTTISQLDQALKFINTLKQLGVSFALDDFGSGVSSFGYLNDLPVDYLKIDGELVRDMDKEEYKRTIIDMINQVATMMQMKTIAEFVENDAVLEELRTLNVNYGQGYNIGKPTPLPIFNR